jgi:prevent-host-death family protein
MTRVTASSARKDFSGTLDRVARKGERIVVQRGGKDVAAIVSVEDLALLEELEDRRDAEDALRIEREAREAGEKPVPLAEVKRRLGI